MCYGRIVWEFNSHVQVVKSASYDRLQKLKRLSIRHQKNFN